MWVTMSSPSTGEDRSRGTIAAEQGHGQGRARAPAGSSRSRGATDRGSPPTTAVQENYSCEAATGARVPAWYPYYPQ
jgi:hypothetical protein